jgi:carboxymethylenebutenolidase
MRKFLRAFGARLRIDAAGVQQDPSRWGSSRVPWLYGGYLAVAAAAADARVNALVVFYAGIPDARKSSLTRLPPLLALHGDADRNVPPAEGTALVDKARALGSAAQLVVYPGAGHGFDFDPTRDNAKDASARALSFLQQQLY